MMKFVNRKDELEFLEKKYRSEEAELIIIYGRRRVGKTELLTRFLEGKRGIYFLGRLESKIETFRRINSLFIEHFKDLSLTKYPLSTWEDVFNYLAERSEKRLVFVIDEFPFIAEKFPEIISILQELWDFRLKRTKIMLVLCGSSIGMMEKYTLSHRSPLYGRRTGQWKVEKIRVKHLREFFPKYSMEDLILVYSCIDTIPGYLTRFSPEKSVWKNIEEKILSKGEFLYEEVEILLREEFRDPSNYLSILSSIAGGSTTFNEIYNTTKLDKSLLSKYLYVLEELNVIGKEFPVTHSFKSTMRGKGAHYSLKDNFFDFYLRFVYPNKQQLESGLSGAVLKEIKEKINPYLGRKFEDFVLEVFHDVSIFPFTKIGRWWYRDREIDVVALNERTKEILFAECKWKSRVNAEKVCEELVEKAEHVQWHNDKRKEYLTVFAKNFSKRIDEFEGRPVFCFDLSDIGKLTG